MAMDWRSSIGDLTLVCTFILLDMVLQLLDDFLQLVFPRLCASCQKYAVSAKAILCPYCEIEIAITKYHLQIENDCTMRLDGRTSLHSGTSMYRFYPQGRVQQMIHRIKYQRQWDIARRLGLRYGSLLHSSPIYHQVDFVVPVPLHLHKLRKRGYNQSSAFAQGLAKAMGVDWSDQLLRRVRNTATQTHKTRLERLENVAGAFELKKSKLLEGRNVLLVDDVLTTGATLEACIEEVQKANPRSVSFATIALAEK
ncbi:MAG: ComF family protein [Saprospiraceae bacterium]|nr:ComF family protein [Saprospiraceae bacterium]